MIQIKMYVDFSKRKPIFKKGIAIIVNEFERSEANFRLLSNSVSF